MGARLLQPKRPRSPRPPTDTTPSPSPPTVPLAPLLSVSVALPGRTGIKLFWGGHGMALGTAPASAAATCKLVAEVIAHGASVAVRSGRVGGRLLVSGEMQDLEIVDGDAQAPELAVVLRRYQREEAASASLAPPPMVRWRFEGGHPQSGEGPRFLLQADSWRYVYLQRLLMELINYINQYVTPLQQRVFAARPEDVLANSAVHRLAAAACPSLLWLQGLPRQQQQQQQQQQPGPSSPFRLPPPDMAFRLQISLVRSRVLLAHASDAADGLIVDLDRYRFWRVRGGGSKGEAYWLGPELVALGEEADDGEADEEGLVFADPVNADAEMLGLLETETQELRARVSALSASQATAQAALHAEHAKLEAAQLQLDAVMIDGVRPLPPSPPQSPPPATRAPRSAAAATVTAGAGSGRRALSPGPVSARIASQMTAVDERERELARVSQELSQAKQRLGRVEAEAGRVRSAGEKEANCRWQHGRALPVKPPNRFDMELVGASISTWRAGESGSRVVWVDRYIYLCVQQ
jgi:hypothetical protein